MEQFPGNSQKAKAEAARRNEPKKIERVTSAEAVRRKRGLGRKFKDVFLAGDTPRDAAEYVLLEHIIPDVRDLLYDAFDAAVRNMIFGKETGRRHRNSSGPYGDDNRPRIDYGQFGSSRPPTRASAQQHRSILSSQSRARGSFDELIIPTRQEAEEVLDQMFEILSRDGDVTVADLYALTGVHISHTDMKWGWTDLRGSKVVPLRRRGGFLLDLPKPISFN